MLWYNILVDMTNHEVTENKGQCGRLYYLWGGHSGHSVVKFIVLVLLSTVLRNSPSAGLLIRNYIVY